MLEGLYKDKAVALRNKLGYSNVMQVPKLIKVCINMGVGEAAADSKAINHPLTVLSLISGQKPVLTYAKKSISGFKIRKGMVIGCKVTLRRNKMYEFLERLLYITLPREKDFRGFNFKQFDGHGNLSLGIQEHTSFLEGDYITENKIRGMDINIITSATNNKDAKELLCVLNFPFVD